MTAGLIPGSPHEPAALPEPPPGGSEGGSLAASVLVPALPAASMLLLGLWRLDRGMWWDEITTYEVATRSLPDILRLLHTVDAVHGLYYLVMHLLLPPGAGDALLLRLPSVIGMAAAAAGTAAIGRRLAGPATGLTAGLVLAAMPLASRYAQEGRSYALVTASVVFSTLALLRALERPTATRWTAYTALVLPTTFLHPFAVLMLGAHGASLLAVRAPRRILRRWLCSAVPTVVCATLFIAYVRAQAAQVNWLLTPTWSAVTDLIRQFAGPTTTMTAVTLAVTACGALSADRWAAGSARIRGFALPWLLLPPGTLFAFSLIEPVYNERYVLYSLPALALLVAGGLNAMACGAAALLAQHRRTAPRNVAKRLPQGLPKRMLAAALGLGMPAALLFAQLPTHDWLRSVESRTDDQTAAARLLAEHGRDGDAVVFLPGTKRGVAYVYRHAFAGLNDVLLQQSPTRSATLTGTEVPAHRIRRLLDDQKRVWVVERATSTRRPDRRTTSAAKRKTLREDFHLAYEEAGWGLTVSLYVRDS
ncbi:glycosyltransferase family 39 protein [Streptomyces flaveus]|uniref:glycosyltransferase family 39 protein n=1 Tax=Streptomyces flaveus TaxID=66370 RepID=UPI003324E8F0